MTGTATYQEYENKTVKNAALLEQGMRHSLAAEDKPEPTASALMLGQLTTLCAMIVAGDAGEKTFSRKRLKKFLAEGKRLDKVKAKSVPKGQGGLA